MSEMGKYRKLVEHLSTSANMMIGWAPSHKAGWVIYLLEALDRNDEKSKEMLNLIKDAITMRLAEGRW